MEPKYKPGRFSNLEITVFEKPTASKRNFAPSQSFVGGVTTQNDKGEEIFQPILIHNQHITGKPFPPHYQGIDILSKDLTQVHATQLTGQVDSRNKPLVAPAGPYTRPPKLQRND